MSKESVLAKGVPENLLIFIGKAMRTVNRFFTDKRPHSLDNCREMEVKAELQVGI